MEAAQRDLPRHLGVVGDQRLVVHLGGQQLMLEALGVREEEAVADPPRLDPVLAEPPLPEVVGVLGADPPDDPVDVAGAGAPPRHARELEEGEVGPGAARLVRVEEVVDGGLVLVDGLLDQPQAEDPGVEVDVVLRVRGDRGDVVDALELHRQLLL
jgi:hypothetical protein